MLFKLFDFQTLRNFVFTPRTTYFVIIGLCEDHSMFQPKPRGFLVQFKFSQKPRGFLVQVKFKENRTR